MIRTFALLLSTLVLLGFVTPKAQAAGLPVVISQMIATMACFRIQEK
jgi:hypothetical protein